MKRGREGTRTFFTFLSAEPLQHRSRTVGVKHRFDEGEQAFITREILNGHQTGNSGDSQESA